MGGREARLAASAGASLFCLVGFATPAQAQPVGEPGDSYTLTNEGWNWYAFDTGTVDNRSGSATIHKTKSHTSTVSKTTTKSGEIGLEINAWITKIHGQFGFSVSRTAGYSVTDTFTVDAPPHTNVRYKDGVIVRHFAVPRVRLAETCAKTTTHGRVNAVENTSVVTDI